ncbi:hypothetical protein AB3Y13_11085 [Vibrio alginolyticus]|uniref:hypothetical protein n=1 Tax=Vibrio sp. B1FLJ16 TaxID=2751178 RepID=UPI0015F40294|nr:hypothetical protein [Vibrio sp. B1FLJ16]CAD7800017.1 hypothetical protein ACOMICROBIO_EPCKBFOG_00577 [Vibrio sp. B1FLJ16]CAE6887606.1 hypothetical protein ACOMICROBIO_EPCKBFOG_00577 [Vibrio sp. B1FLJ16]
MSRQAEVKVQLLKFIEISYKYNKGVTTKLVTGGKRFKLAVDDSGKVTLSGELGFTKFEVSKEMVEELGIKLKSVSVTFQSHSDGNLTYSGSVSLFGVVTFGVTGQVNIRELVEKCEWGLCKYRFKPSKIDQALREAGA